MGAHQTPDLSNPHLKALMQERKSFYDSFFVYGRITSIIVGIIVLLMLINWATG